MSQFLSLSLNALSRWHSITLCLTIKFFVCRYFPLDFLSLLLPLSLSPITVQSFIPFHSSLYLHPSLTLIVVALLYIFLSLSASLLCAQCIQPVDKSQSLFITTYLPLSWLKASHDLAFILSLSLSLSLSTFDVYDVLCALVLHEEKNNWIYRLRGPFKFRAIVIMRFCITSFFAYSDQLFLYHLVY